MKKVAWYTLRLAIAESAYSGQKTALTAEHINQLKNLAKLTGKNLFSDLSVSATGKTMDTDQYEITAICDEDYWATFKIQATGGWHLIDYTFENSDEKGYEIIITKE